MINEINEDRLKSLLEEDMLSIRLEVAGKEVNIEPSLWLTHTLFKTRGYTLTINGDAQKEKIKNFKALIERLKKLGAAERAYTVIKIDDRYGSLEELEEKKRFDEISMAELLKKYSAADRFELVHPLYGDDYCFGEEQGKSALKELKEQEKLVCKSQFDLISEEERTKLPDFETLYALIEKECEKFRADNADKIASFDGMAFFCDEFAHGNTKFTHPSALWHIYHAVDFIETCAYQIKSKQAGGADGKNAADLNLPLNVYPQLKAALTDSRITFTWHCTTSGSPAIVYSFKLNEQTRGWLLTRKDDYDLPDGLEDLALYQGKDVLFSSCTHERFHTGKKI